MNAAELANKIDWEGGILEAMEYGVRDSDIDDEDLSEAWYEMHIQWENLSGDMSEFEDMLANKLDEEDSSPQTD